MCTYSVDIHRSLSEGRSRWSRMAVRAAAVTAPRPPWLTASDPSLSARPLESALERRVILWTSMKIPRGWKLNHPKGLSSHDTAKITH